MSKELKYYDIIPLKCIQFECIFIKVQMKVKLKNEKVQIIFSNKIFSSRKVNGSCQGLGTGQRGLSLSTGYRDSVLQDEKVLEICCAARCM